MKKLVGCLFCVFSLYGESPVNLDYAACADSSLEALLEFVNVSVLAGNSSGINPHAERLRYIEYISAEVIAQKMKTSGDKLLFVTSASMANNIAILGVAKKHPGCHMITTKIEHKSVLNIFKYLETQGYRVTYLNVDRNGLIDMNQLQKSISSDTKLISIQMVNSEIGALQDMDAIGKLARQHNVLFHSDASQAFGKYDIDVDKIGIDLLTVSGYKIGAPKGIAALYVKDADKMLEPVLYGSGNPLYPGSRPTALIAAFAKALQVHKWDWEKIHANFELLRDEISKMDDVYINSDKPSHIFSVSVGGVRLADILEKMQDFSFSAGCSCLGRDESNVIGAINESFKAQNGRDLPTCTLRISFGCSTTKEQIQAFCKKLKEVVGMLRRDNPIGDGCEAQYSPDLNGVLFNIADKIRAEK